MWGHQRHENLALSSRQIRKKMTGSTQLKLLYMAAPDIKSHFKPRPPRIHSALHKGGAHAVPTLRDITFSHQKGTFSAEKYAD
jgi:hypothetical protein